jgi:hypothetical protein
MPQGGMPIQAPQVDPMAEIRAKAKMQFEAAVKLLRDDKLRGFRIDIETDSTIDPDPESEKQARVEFLTASSQFLHQSLEVGMTAPQLRPLLGKMLLFGVRGFRAGRELETAFEETLDALEREAKQPKHPQPSPEEIKAQAEQKKLEMEMQFRQQEMEFEAAQKQAEAQRNSELQQMELQFKREEHQMKMQELVRKSQIDLMKYQLDLEKMQAGVVADGQKAQIQADADERKSAYEMANAERKYQFDGAAMDRQAAHDEASLERQGKADERKPAIAEQALKAKANAAGNSAST